MTTPFILADFAVAEEDPQILLWGCLAFVAVLFGWIIWRVIKHQRKRKVEVIAPNDEASHFRVFICYRRTDGLPTAKWLHSALHDQALTQYGQPGRLYVYLDIETPSVPDWTKIHLPSLQDSKALIFVATPGACASIPTGDWVKTELDWWLKNRTVPPIVIETTGEGARWIPLGVTKRWPNLQRIEVNLKALDQVPPHEKATEEARLIDVILRSIAQVVPQVLFEQVERERRLRQNMRMLLWLALILCAVSSFSFWRGRMVGLEKQESERKAAVLTSENMRLSEQIKQYSEFQDKRARIEEPRTSILVVSDTNEALSFSPGEAEPSPEFRDYLITRMTPLLKEASETNNATVLEVVGYTDTTRITQTGPSGIDALLSRPVALQDIHLIRPASNVELGMLRALAVSSVLDPLMKLGKLGRVNSIRCLSGAPTLSSEPDSLEDRHTKRRIEMRLLRQ